MYSRASLEEERVSAGTNIKILITKERKAQRILSVRSLVSCLSLAMYPRGLLEGERVSARELELGSSLSQLGQALKYQ